MKRVIALFLSLLMIASLSISAFAAEPQQDLHSQNMVDILLSTDDNRFIVVSVPESKAAAYQERLETDPVFRQNEIQTALMSIYGSQDSSRELPPGIIEYQKYMYKGDIRNAVDAYAGAGSFDEWFRGLSWFVKAADVAGLIKLANAGTIFALSADLLGTLMKWAQQERQEWWETAYADIINGTILAVRYTIIQSNTEYPKAWRVFERV